MEIIGKINREIFKAVSEHIRTDEVVLTDERIQHIKSRHPGDYERYFSLLPDILAAPDYIIEANKPHTAVILKEITTGENEKFKLVLWLRVEDDPEEYKNSILSFWRIGEATWSKTLKNKKILYKNE